VADIPGSRFYAVNDRPVAVVPTAEGGSDCVVFDFATGELVPDRSYFAFLIPGSGKDVDALTEGEFAARLATCRAEAGIRRATQVREWAQRLCTATGGAADVAAALGLPAVVTDGDAGTVDPPLPGYHRISVTPQRGTSQLARVSATLRPAGCLLTRAVLDARFGAGRELPIFPDSWDEGHVAYQVAVPGVPAQCTVFVRFRHQAALEIALRRDEPG
jgi:hypothetical protein